MEKEYVFKVYTKEGSFLTNWTDVVSEPEFNQEINSAGGQMKITLARNAGDYGEGTDIDFGYDVKIYCYDTDEPNGLLVFNGYISSYQPTYADNKVDVMLLSYGEELGKFLIQDSLLETYAQETYTYQSSQSISTTGSVEAIEFTPTTDEMCRVKALDIMLTDPWANAHGGDTFNGQNMAGWFLAKSGTVGYDSYSQGLPMRVRISLWKGDWYDIYMTGPTGADYGSNIYNPDVKNWLGAWQYIPKGTLPAYYVGTGLNIRPVFRLTLPSEVTLTKSALHTMMITIDYENPGDSYDFWMKTYANQSSQLGLVGAFLLTYSETGTTTVPFLSQDPSDILRGIIDRYRDLGGKLNYTAESIEDTGTTVSYTFNTNTTLEGIQKCLDLAPAGWYWYIDYATNLVHFHPEDTSPTHTFSLEKDVLDLKIEKRIEDLINTIYFTGGEVGGLPLYKKYYNTNSIEKYGIKAAKYLDNRVTVASTAETIANSILEKRSEPELRTTMVILDSTGDGYDIESIKVGDVIGVRNVSQKVGLSTWDASRWDEDYWDFNIQNLSTLQMQVQKINYKPDKVELFASTIAPDVNKRIEDINRNLESLQTINNDVTPG